MAAALNTLVRNPNPSPAASPFARPPYLALSRSLVLPIRRLNPSWNRCLSARLLSVDRRISRLVPLAAEHDESKQLDVEVEKQKDELEAQAGESEEAWKKTLESVKEEALKLKEKSQEAYEVYSEKAMVILLETSEKLKIQAEKARQDLSVLSKEISQEGQEYLATAAQNSPKEVKDIVETFASVDDLKDVSAFRDFHVGIPYGAFLVLGGFLSFMLTGSIPAIRFGIVLGGALLALSVSSLRSWKSGKHSPLLLKGQAAIATILFIREWQLFSRWKSFPTFSMTLVSGVVLAFYIYRLMVDGSEKDPRPDKESE